MASRCGLDLLGEAVRGRLIRKVWSPPPGVANLGPREPRGGRSDGVWTCGRPGFGTAPRMGEEHRSRAAGCGVQRLGGFGGAVALARARARNRAGRLDIPVSLGPGSASSKDKALASGFLYYYFFYFLKFCIFKFN